MRRSHRKLRLIRSHGFSLLELILALALLTSTTLLAVTGMHHLRARIHMNTNINNLLHTIHEARSRALVTGSEVVICPSQNALRCDNDNAWDDGWLAFQAAAPGRRQPGANDRRLARGDRMQGLRVTANRQVFVMRPFGRRSTNGTWVFCDTLSSVAPRALVLSYTGKPRISLTGVDGRRLTCPQP